MVRLHLIADMRWLDLVPATHQPCPMRRLAKVLVWFMLLVMVAPVLTGAVTGWARGWPDSWRSADWSSTGTLPTAGAGREAMVAIYAARSGRWKGVVAVHHWIVVKPADSQAYVRYDVVGWGNPVRRNHRAPDARWYGNAPRVIHEVRGHEAEALIGDIEAAIADYPWSNGGTYRAWPGPNSNSFVAYVLRRVPGFGAELDPTGIGKDYMGPGLRFGPTPSGTGWQVSAWGVFGAALARAEGLELHVLGATIGIDPQDLAIKLPGLGAIGLKQVRDPS
jgi:hypothetical protein